MGKRVTLKDIAEQLNMTVNTISRALSDQDDISSKTKELVQKTAYDLGYIPDIIASSMRTSKTMTIAVLHDNLRNPYFMIMAAEIDDKLTDLGYQMMIFTSTRSEAVLTFDIFKKMASRRVDAVITFLRPEPKVAKIANQIKLPILMVGREGDDLNVDSIYNDDYSGGYQMGEFFYEQGYKNVGYLGGPETLMNNIKRAQGLNDYYSQHNLTTHLIHSIHGKENLDLMIEELLSKNVEAIFCFNDANAFYAIKYLSENHPNSKVEISGYDNISNKLGLPLNFTTVSSNTEILIEESIKRVMSKIDNFDQPLLNTKLETKLVKKHNLY